MSDAQGREFPGWAEGPEVNACPFRSFLVGHACLSLDATIVYVQSVSKWPGSGSAEDEAKVQMQLDKS